MTDVRNTQHVTKERVGRMKGLGRSPGEWSAPVLVKPEAGDSHSGACGVFLRTSVSCFATVLMLPKGRVLNSTMSSNGRACRLLTQSRGWHERSLALGFVMAILSGLEGSCLVTQAQTAVGNRDTQPEPIILNSGSFQIPFDVTNSGSRPREVRLYMAQLSPRTSAEDALAVRFPGQVQPVGDRPDPISNQAPQWRLLDRQPPGVGQFLLSETPDGTFLFTTRTIDQQGRPHPDGPMQADLRVTIDTLPPVIEIDSDADADGSMNATIAVQDATRITVLSTHYITDTTQQWQSVSVDSRPEGVGFEIAPKDNWQQLSVRVRAVDSAGNEAVENHLVRRPRIATLPSARLASGPSQLNLPHSVGAGASVGQGQANGYSVPTGPAYPGTALQRGYGQAPWATPGSHPRFANAAQAEILPTPVGSGELSLPPPATAEEISEAFASGYEPIPAPLPEANPNRGAVANPSNGTPDPSSLPETPQDAMRPLAPEPSRPVAGNGAIAENLPAPAGQLAPMPNAADQETRSLKPETPFVAETIPTPNARPEPPSELVAPNVNDPNAPRIDATDSNAGTGDDLEEGGRDSSTKEGWRPKSQLPPRTEDKREVSGNPVSRQTVKRPSLEELSQLAPVQHSTSNRFSLEYELEAVGTQGLEAVELYGTEDGGATWKRWGADPDKASPFDIETISGGVFGFHIVVVGANGLASPRPLAGDLPQMVVVVDQEEPEVTLTGAKYGEGEFTGSLIVQWRARDEFLAERPITLAFGESTDGPWTTIAGGVRNSGQYAWPADAALPSQIYVRIDAADEAGNVGTYVLDTPIDTRGLAPRARIRGFRPIASAGSGTTR